MARKANDGKGRLGGRKKGTPNKKTQDLMAKAEELDVDPFEILLLFAKGDYKALGLNKKDITPQMRSVNAADACQYLYPRRKAVDLKTGDDGSPIIINFVEKKK